MIAQPERQHADGQRPVRELQHLLLAWELLGELRREAFEQRAQALSRSTSN